MNWEGASGGLKRRDVQSAPARPFEAVCDVGKAKAIEGLHHVLLDALAVEIWRMSYFSKIAQHRHS